MLKKSFWLQKCVWKLKTENSVKKKFSFVKIKLLTCFQNIHVCISDESVSGPGNRPTDPYFKETETDR